MTKPARYRLNYGWAQLHNWDEETSEVSLEVVLRGDDLAKLTTAVAAWRADFGWAKSLIDGLYVEYEYHGGCWFQVEKPTLDYLRLWINSSGQDAFDSIHWYAETLYHAVVAVDPAVRITWNELPHRPRAWQHLQ